MIGLEYLLQIYGLNYTDLANKLGISRQNVSIWLSGNRKIPKKYYSILSEIFKGIPENYFQEEIDDFRRLDIQQIKIMQERNPEIGGFRFEYSNGNVIEKPFYDDEELEQLEKKKEIADLVQRFQKLLNNPLINFFCKHQFDLFLEFFEKTSIEECPMMGGLIESICIQYGLLEGENRAYASEQFVNDIMNVLKKHTDNGNDGFRMVFKKGK